MVTQIRGGRWKTTRIRRFRFCPNCGYDLEEQEPTILGDLYSDPVGDTFWKGERVNLTATMRLIVNTLITAEATSAPGGYDGGFYVKASVIADRSGCAESALGAILTNIRGRFRQIDPEFDQIESTHGAKGWRWKEKGKARRVRATWTKDFTLHTDNTFTWRQRFTLMFSPNEAAIMEELLRARGNFVSRQELMKKFGKSDKISSIVTNMKRKFQIADHKGIAIFGKTNFGYKLVRWDDAEALAIAKRQSEKLAASRIRHKPTNKMSIEKARDIRRRHDGGNGEHLKDLAKEYGIALSTIYGIVSHQTWREQGEIVRRGSWRYKGLYSKHREDHVDGSGESGGTDTGGVLPDAGGLQGSAGVARGSERDG